MIITGTSEPSIGRWEVAKPYPPPSACLCGLTSEEDLKTVGGGGGGLESIGTEEWASGSTFI